MWFAFLVFFGGTTVFMTDRLVTACNTNWWSRTEGFLESVTSERLSGETYYKIKVRYNYSVAGEQFTGDRISYRTYDEGISGDELTALQRRKVDVYYNPNNPSQAVLSRGVGFFNFVFWGVPFVLLLVTLFVGFYVLRFKRLEVRKRVADE